MCKPKDLIPNEFHWEYTDKQDYLYKGKEWVARFDNDGHYTISQFFVFKLGLNIGKLPNKQEAIKFIFNELKKLTKES